MRSPSWAASCCIVAMAENTDMGNAVDAGRQNLLNYNYTQLERNRGEIRNGVVAVNGSF
jgi:hypothetical protein